MQNYWTIARKNKYILAALIIVLGSLAGFFIYARENPVLPQASIYFLDNVQLPEKGQKVLVFSPHPDDESIGVGGYIYDSIKAGAEVEIILVTDGNKHKIKDRRYEEFRQATGILGVNENNLVFLNYPDGQLKEQNEVDVEKNFSLNIAAFSPDIIIYPDSRDDHSDHATTGKIVEKVLSAQKFQGKVYSYLVHHDRFPQPKKMASNMFLLPPSKMISFDDQWQKLMLSREALSAKNAAILSYQSQLRVPILRSEILSSIRQNELFSVRGK
jgi:LmbE family N-acetylglucosaminyl deacetylase